MTWVSHQSLTFSLILALTNNLLFAMVSAVGSILPDWMEGKGHKSQDPYMQERWRQNHRKLSHWFIPYVIFAFFSLAFFDTSSGKLYATQGLPTFFEMPQSFAFGWIGLALSVGAILHIVQDAISGKVPLLNPKKKSFGVRLIPTRSFKEGVFTLGGTSILLSLAYLIYWR